MSARSRNASAILALRPDGNGAAASILAAGRANDFDEARGDFETAWRVFLAKRTGADFQKWRDHRDWTERKYAAWDAGERVLA